MVTAREMEKVEKRARWAAFEDGWYEILAGAFFLLMGFLILVNPTLIPFAACLILVFKPLTEGVRRRLIYPRMGFVQLPEPEKTGAETLRIVAISVGVFAGSAFLLMAFAEAGEGWQTWMDYVMPGLVGLGCAFGPVWSARNQGFIRGYLYAAVLALCGVGLPLGGLAYSYDAVAFTCLGVGVLAALIGSVSLVRFLLRNPVAEGSHVSS